MADSSLQIRGPLRYQVETSTPQIEAGKEFCRVGNLALLPQPLLNLDYVWPGLAQRTSITADSRSPSTWFAPRARGRKPRNCILGLIRCINQFLLDEKGFGEL